MKRILPFLLILILSCTGKFQISSDQPFSMKELRENYTVISLYFGGPTNPRTPEYTREIEKIYPNAEGIYYVDGDYIVFLKKD